MHACKLVLQTTACDMAAGRPAGSDPDQEQEGKLSLSKGLRFHPSDEELIGIFLFNEAIGGPTVTSRIKIPLLDVYGKEPWELREHADTSFSVAGEFYCFARLKSSSARGNRIQRRTPNGFWKVESRRWDVPNNNDPERPCIGHRILLKFFYVGAGSDSARSKKGEPMPWVMHEYRLRESFWSMASANGDELVICRINSRGSEEPYIPDDGAESSSSPKHARTDTDGYSEREDANNGAPAASVGGDAPIVVSCDSTTAPPLSLGAAGGARVPPGLPHLDVRGGGVADENDSPDIYMRYMKHLLGEQMDLAAAPATPPHELPISPEITQRNKNRAPPIDLNRGPVCSSHSDHNCDPAASGDDSSGSSSWDTTTLEKVAIEELVSLGYTSTNRER